MKTPAILFSLLGAAVLAAQEPPPQPPAPEPTPPQTLREAVNSLDPAQMQKAMEALQSNFLDPAALDEPSRQRALVEGMIRRLSPGAALVPSTPPPQAGEPVPFLAEILDGRAGYMRMGTLNAATLSQLDVALASFVEKKLPAVILDLRGVPAGGEFEMAADFARRFCPKGKILFTIQKPSAKQERILTSNQNPAFEGIVVVLTDGHTSGAAEALAATLRLNARAMIVGSDTSGEAVEFAEVALGGGHVLRIAVSQIVLPGTGPLFPHGVKPDVAIALPGDVQTEIFAASRENGVSQFVFDTERPRINEASLIANTNPEIEGEAAAQKERNTSPLRDSVLQRAMDLVTAIAFYKKQN